MSPVNELNALDDYFENFRELGYRTWLMYDLPDLGEQVIYVMAFENGYVKVGQTVDWDSRVKAHSYNPRVRGHKRVSTWWQRSFSALEDERALIQAARDLAGVVAPGSREWFTGVDHAALTDWAGSNLAIRPRPSYSGQLPRTAVVS